jgi:hypothetical protein
MVPLLSSAAVKALRGAGAAMGRRPVVDSSRPRVSGQCFEKAEAWVEALLGPAGISRMSQQGHWAPRTSLARDWSCRQADAATRPLLSLPHNPTPPGGVQVAVEKEDGRRLPAELPTHEGMLDEYRRLDVGKDRADPIGRQPVVTGASAAPTSPEANSDSSAARWLVLVMPPGRRASHQADAGRWPGAEPARPTPHIGERVVLARQRQLTRGRSRLDAQSKSRPRTKSQPWSWRQRAAWQPWPKLRSTRTPQAEVTPPRRPDG